MCRKQTSAVFLRADELQQPKMAETFSSEMSRSAAYNNTMFLNGNGQKVIYFAECLLAGTPPAKSNLEYALEIMKWYEAHYEAPGKPIKIG